MLDDYFVRPFARNRLRAEPLGPFLEGFVAWLEEQRYPHQHIRLKLSHVSFLNRWLQKRALGITQLDEEVARCCVASRRRSGKLERNELHTYQQVIEFLRRAGHLPPREQPVDTSPARELLDDLRAFLLEERRVSGMTATRYIGFVQAFLHRRFGDAVPKVEELKLDDLTGFLLALNQTTPGQVSLAATVLRTFGRFLLARGVAQRDISLGLPRGTRWRLASLPERLTHPEVESLLSSQDRRTEAGKRDYALLMIFARLGLRNSEVGHLTLADVDWRGGTLRILGKGGIECPPESAPCAGRVR